MPHIQIRGEISLERMWETIGQLRLLKPDPIIIDPPYMLHNRKALLFQTSVTEHGRSQKFYLIVSAREEGLTVRVDPVTDPVKSDGVKRAVGFLAAHIKSMFPGAEYGVTNIPDFVMREIL